MDDKSLCSIIQRLKIENSCDCFKNNTRPYGKKCIYLDLPSKLLILCGLIQTDGQTTCIWHATNKWRPPNFTYDHRVVIDNNRKSGIHPANGCAALSAAEIWTWSSGIVCRRLAGPRGQELYIMPDCNKLHCGIELA